MLSAEADGQRECLDRAKALVGKKLSGKWRLERLLGIGATSSVFAASHRNGHRVAVKVLHPELSLNRKARQRFLREGYLANRVGHPGVVTVIDDGVTRDGTVFLVLELLNGESLSSLAARRGGRLRERELLKIADGVLDALGAAHRQGVVHRDIKPANLFLTDEGAIKILDFGLARLSDAGAQSVLLTHHDSVIGTPAYMAPEQARGSWDQIDARTDIWCFGATMFRLLTGRTVHLGQTFNQMLVASATQCPALLRSIEPGISEATANAVDRALRLDPDERWADAAAMRQALAHALTTLTEEQPANAGESLETNGAGERSLASVLTLSENDPSLSAARSQTFTLEPELHSESWSDRRKRRSRLLTVGGALALALSTVGALALRSAPGPAIRPGAFAASSLLVRRSVAPPVPVAVPPEPGTPAAALPNSVAENTPAAPVRLPSTKSSRRAARVARPANASESPAQTPPVAASAAGLPEDVLDNRK